MLCAALAAVFVIGFVDDARAQVIRAFSSRYSRTDRGNFVAIGNTLMTCPDSASACANARAGLGSTNNNQDFTMIPIDVDTVDAGANSSTATLALPAGSTVRFAALYWGASSSSAGRSQVRLRTPASSVYSALTATQLDASGTAYHAFADVTSQVAAAGNGAYTVADVKAVTGTNAYAGWSLVVVYSDPSEPPHNVTVFDGFASVTNGGGGVTIPVSGFVTPPTGVVSTSIAVGAYEGDLGSPGNSVRVNSVSLTNAVNPANNFFNSTISVLGAHATAKTPNYVNQFGFDLDVVDASGMIANAATSASLSFAAGSDSYLPGVLVFATDISQPLLAPNFSKSVTDVNGGVVTPGDVLEYSIALGNTGNDSADAVVLTDAIPAGTTFVPGSLSVVSGANAGSKTDASGDDQAEMDTAGNRVVFRLGTGATSVVGGSLATATSTEVRFRVQIGAGVANGTTILNQARATYTERQLGNTVAVESNSVASTIRLPDLTVAKSHSAAFVRGATGTYAIVVTNSGTGGTAGTVTVTDPLPTGLTPTAAGGSGWNCSIGGATATCTRSDSLAAGASWPAIQIDALVAQSASSALTNTVTVSGGGEVNVANDNASDLTAITSSADLAVSKSGPFAAAAGSNLVFTVAVTNNGSSDAASVSVADPTPSGLTFVSNSGACATAYPCTLGTVPSGATSTITTTYFVPSGYPIPGTIVNMATASSATADPVPSNNSSSVSIPVSPSTDLSITKTGPSSLVAGNSVVYTVVVSNLGTLGASAVIVVDPTPAGLSFVSNSGACTTAYPCSLGAVAAGSTRTITTTYAVPASYTGPSPVVNTASVSSSTADSDPANDTSVASTTVATSADLAIAKTGPSSVVAGESLTYSVMVTNNGSSDASAVVVADPTPSGLAFVSNTGDCTTAYPCALGAVAAGSTRTITSTYTVPAAYAGPDPVVNTASVSSGTSDPVAANNTATSSIPVLRRADLAITKSGPANVMAGGSVVYTLTVTNAGSSDATAVTVTDPTPSGLSFVSNSGSCSTAFPCSLGTLAAGGSRTITSTYSVPPSYTAPNPIVNTATVASGTVDPVPGNNEATSSTPLVVRADLSIGKTGPGSVLAGENLTYTVVVTNDGAADATAVTVADATPPGLVFLSNTGACTTAYPCSLGTVPAGATRTILTTYTVPASFTSPDPIVNTATVSAGTSDPDPGNDSAAVSTSVSASADLRIEKSGPGSVVAGSNAVYTVTITNDGVSDAANVGVADPTPAGLVFVSNTGDCTTAYPCSLGTIASGAVRTITTTYTVPASYTVPDPVVNAATVSSSTTDPDSSDNLSTASVPVTTRADLGATVLAPIAVIAGSNLVYVVEITNQGESDALDVVATDAAPAGLVFVSNSGDCATAYPCLLGTIPNGESRTITTTYTVPGAYTAPDPIVNTVTASSSTGDPDPGDNSGTASTSLTIIDADLGVSVTGPGTVVPGTDITYSTLVTNDGPDDADSVVVAGATPPGLVFVSNSGSCVTSYPCSLGTLVAGATRTILTTYSIPPSYTAPDPVQKTLRVSSDYGDSNPSNNESTSSATVSPSADLSVSNTGPATAVSGTNVSYTLVVTNNGSSDAVGVTITNPTPAGVVFVSNSGDCTSAYPCSYGTLAAGSSLTIVTTYFVPTSYAAPGLIVDTATVASGTSDPDPGDNTAAVSTSVSSSSDLEITKTDATDPVQVGAAEVYTLTVLNHGPSDATSVLVMDSPDANTTVVSDTGGCVAGSGTLACSLGALASGASTSFTVTVLVNEGTPDGSMLRDGPCDGSEDICNTATVVADQSDPDPSNDTATQPTDVEDLRVEGLSLAVTDSPDPVLTGSVLNYVVTYSNAGTTTITNARLTLAYDAATTFASATPAPSSGEDVWELGALVPGTVGSVTITVDVDGGASDGDTLLASAALTGDRAIRAEYDEETLVREDGTGHAALSVIKTVSPGSAPSGGLLTYTITVSNDGPATSYATVVSDPLPPELSFLNAAPAPDAVTGALLEWDAGDLAAGASVSYVVYASTEGTLSAGSLVENTAQAEGATGPGTVASAGLGAEGSVVATISGAGADCGLVVRLRSMGIALPGGEFLYRLLWEDPCDEAPGTTISHDLPPDVSFVTMSSSDVSSFAVQNAGDHERVVLEVGALARGHVGAAFVRGRLSDGLAPGTLLESDLQLEDAAGRTVSASDVSTVQDSLAMVVNRSYLRVTGPLRVIAGSTPSYVVRYRDVPPGTTLTVSVTRGLQPVATRPFPSERITPPPIGTTAAWAWHGLEGRGIVRIRGQAVFDGPADGGGVISIDALLSSSEGVSIAKSGRDVGVLNPMQNAQTPLLARGFAVLKTQHFARGGKSAAARLRYRDLLVQPTVTMNLPTFLESRSFLPAIADEFANNAFRWGSLPVKKGVVLVKSVVPEDMTPQTSLAIGATVTDGLGTLVLERAKGAQ